VKVDKIFILINHNKNKIDDTKNKLSIKNNHFLDNLLTKIIKYDFKKIYLLCPFENRFFYNRYHKKKIHKSTIHCVKIGVQLNLCQILIKLEKKTNNNFIFLDGKKFIDMNYFDLIKSKIGNKLVEISLIKDKNNFSFKNKPKNIGLYLFNIKIFNFIKNNFSLDNENIIQNLNVKNKTLTRFYKGNVINNTIFKNSNHLKKKNSLLKNKALFLDRDGVINKHNGYVLNYRDFIFLPGVKKAIKYANSRDYLVIIITNQSAIGRSWMKESDLHKIHNLMKKDMYAYNESYIDDIYYSPHYYNSKHRIYRQNSKDRKPNSGMLVNAIKKWNIDIEQSIFIGDQETDKLAAERCKIKFYYKINYSLHKQIKSII
tara:strand:- start:3623 stop:4738 length:1116 start_codon:yes stop_codon:yes gene_type:complete